jgi:5-methylcytosine-specific restriction protein A
MVNRRGVHRNPSPRRKEAPRDLTTAKRGYDYNWQKLRKWKLATDPFCAMCNGSANQVDHILPINDGGERLDPANLQSLCISCHSKKTAVDKANRKVRD